jgi:siroheme synthase-like protein
MPRYFPVYLDIARRKCVVVGGGEVALRKVQSLLDCQAAVTVVSPAFSGGLEQLAQQGAVTLVRRKYLNGDLNGAMLAIAATDERETNIEVSREAREKTIPVNVVDVPDFSDFIVPSYFSRGDITIAVSTAGGSPALARKIRTRLQTELGEEYAVLARIASDVRREMKRQGRTVDAEHWQQALDVDRLLTLIRQGDQDGARRLLSDNLRAKKEGLKP